MTSPPLVMTSPSSLLWLSCVVTLSLHVLTTSAHGDFSPDAYSNKRWAPSDIDVFKRELQPEPDTPKRWAPSDLSLLKRDPWASSEIRKPNLAHKLRTRVARDREYMIQGKRSGLDLLSLIRDMKNDVISGGIPESLYRKLRHVEKRAAPSSSHVPVGMGAGAAQRALGMYAQLLDGQRAAGGQANTKIRFIGK